MSSTGKAMAEIHAKMPRHFPIRQTPWTLAVEFAFLVLLLLVFWQGQEWLTPPANVPPPPPEAAISQVPTPSTPVSSLDLQVRLERGDRSRRISTEGCTQLVVNGDFEQFGGWTIPITARPGIYTTERAVSGTRSLRLGVTQADAPAYTDSTAYQYLTLPADVTSITLRAQLWRSASGVGNHFQYVWLTAGGRTLELMRSQADSQAWETLTADLTPLRGQRVRLLFGAFNSGQGGRAAMFVDDVEVWACSGEAPPITPSPTPTPSPSLANPVFLPVLQGAQEATPEPTLEPTLEPTPLPSPTSTPPSASPPCQELAVNPDFEADAGWSMPITQSPARYSEEQVWSGRRSLRVGIPPGEANRTTDSTAYQWIQLPVDVERITLTARVWRQGSPGGGDYHYTLVQVGGVSHRVFLDLFDERRWETVTFDLTSWRGRQVLLLFGTFNDGLGGTAVMYVDGVSVQACRPGEVPATPAPTATPSPVPQPPEHAEPGEMASPDFGVNAFLWWRPEIAERDLRLIREAGFRWVRQSFAWEDIEQARKGAFLWDHADRVVRQTNEAGLMLLARLGTNPGTPSFWAGKPPENLDDFVDFVAVLAQRYNCSPQAVGCIQAYQIWNEPNLAREWGGNRPDPARYAALLRDAYRVIKEANPQALVITAGMAPTGTDNAEAMPDEKFYRELYRAMGGSSDGYFDLLGVHGPGFAAPPELDPAQAAANPQYGGHRFFSFRHIEDIRAIMVANGDADKRMAVLEFGWTSDPVNPDYYWFGAGAGIDEFVKADYLVRAYRWAKEQWRPWIGVMSALTMPNLDWLADGNPMDEEQYWWAIMEPSELHELRFRPAYIALCRYLNAEQGRTCPHDP